MKHHDFGIFLACHQRSDDLLCHLDRLKYLDVPHEAFVLYSGARTLPFIPNMIRFNAKTHAPVRGVLWALREARRLGLKYILYNNADDILFRNDLVCERLCKLQEYDFCGYSWYGKERRNDLTVNELYMKVSSFEWLDLDQAERTLDSKSRVSIEHELAAVLQVHRLKWYRLSDREIPRGIGYMTRDPLHRDNNRWFCRQWQLITSHCPWQRWEFYKAIRSSIPYHQQLEREQHFGRWVGNNMKLDLVIPEIISDKRTLLGGSKLFWLGHAILDTRGLPGDLAEVGIYQGGLVKLMAMLRPEKTVHGFDTFAGIPHEDQAKGHHKPGEFACDLANVQNYLSQLSNVSLHQGVFPDTAADLDRQFCCVHVDCDTYQSTLAAIDYFWPRLATGGWIVFDDYHWSNTPGVDKALAERFSPEQLQTRPESDNQAFVQK